MTFGFAFPRCGSSLGQPLFASAQTAVDPSDGGWPLFYVAAPVAGTSLFWISNTENDLFPQKATGTFHHPIASRDEIRSRTFRLQTATTNLQPATNHVQALSAALRPFMDHTAAPGDGLPTTRASGRTRGVVSSMVHILFALRTSSPTFATKNESLRGDKTWQTNPTF